MKYYYDDPLAAAFMAKHFEMKFLAAKEIQEIRILCEIPYVIEQNHSPYYIHLDSLHLLEPVLKDVIYTELKVGGVSIELLQSEERVNQAPCFMSRGAKIIQRNGIPFHWPEVEA